MSGVSGAAPGPGSLSPPDRMPSIRFTFSSSVFTRSAVLSAGAAAGSGCVSGVSVMGAVPSPGGGEHAADALARPCVEQRPVFGDRVVHGGDLLRHFMHDRVDVVEPAGHLRGEHVEPRT